MFCLNVPKKTTALIQVWTSMLLIVIAVILSFMPIVNLQIADRKTIDAINEMVEEISGEEVSEIPSEIEVSAPKMYGSISMIVKFISAIGSENEELAQEVKAMMEGEEGRNTVLMVAAIAASFMDIFGGEEDEKKPDGLAMILKVLVVLICLLYVLGFTLIIPIIVVITAIVALISALKNLKAPEEAAPIVSKKLLGLITLPMTFILFQCVLPTMHYGVGALGIWIVSFICVALCLIVSRLHMYTPAQMKYANVLQGTAIVGIIGYLVFFFNVINVGAFDSLISGKWASYVTQVVVIQANGGKVPSFGYLIDAALILVAVILVLSSVNYFKSCANRLSCTAGAGKNNKKPKDSNLVSSIIYLLIYILPVYVMGATNCLKDPTSTSTKGAESFLVLSEEQNSALTMALVGLIIMIVAEVALLVLKKTVCKDVPADEMMAVFAGTAQIPAAEEAPAEETPVEEAPAEEAPAAEDVPAFAEEAPAEEAPVEEAPAEEAPAEEAPAEETPAEEAPAEEQ